MALTILPNLHHVLRLYLAEYGQQGGCLSARAKNPWQACACRKSGKQRLRRCKPGFPVAVVSYVLTG